jgi:hypothetical protein
MRRYSVAVVFVLLAVNATAQHSEFAGFKTRGYGNGRLWSVLSNLQKGAFVDGLQDGLANAFDLCGKAEATDRIITHLSLQETVAAIDAFYRDSINAPIPIALAYSVVSRKAHGATADELDQLVVSLRRWSIGQ